MVRKNQSILRYVSLLFWIAIIGTFWWFTQSRGISPLETVRRLIEFERESEAGSYAYVLFYVVQPIVFFPSSLLTIAAGYLFGPVWGTILAIVGSNGSSVLAWYVGRFLGTTVIQDGRDVLKDSRFRPMLSRYRNRLQSNGFEAVLMMRLIYMPYDFVSYFSGFARIPLRDFVLATALGAIPGTISFALFGASIQGEFLGEMPSINPLTLVTALGLFVTSLTISRLLRARNGIGSDEIIGDQPAASKTMMFGFGKLSLRLFLTEPELAEGVTGQSEYLCYKTPIPYSGFDSPRFNVTYPIDSKKRRAGLLNS
ncbi:MAG: TVP38/TMEM64 family protein [Chloroflexota bacterium]